MRNVLLGMIGAVLFCATGVALAQDRVRIEIVPGGLFTTEEFADADLGSGLGALRHVAAEVGFSRSC